MNNNFKLIEGQAEKALETLYEKGNLQKGNLVIVGCSTSEVVGGHIGKNSVPEVGKAIALAFINKAGELGLQVGFQCCEHLNRAVCMEKEVLLARGCAQVAAIPVPKAGGSVPAGAWDAFDKPALAMAVQGEAVIDIGDTLVGMHIRPVAVPVRMEEPYVGKARVVMAYARPPYIGGERAVYQK